MLRVKGSWKPSLCVLTQVNSRVLDWAEARHPQIGSHVQQWHSEGLQQRSLALSYWHSNTSPPIDAVSVFVLVVQRVCILLHLLSAFPFNTCQIQLALRPLVVYQTSEFWSDPDSISISGISLEGDAHCCFCVINVTTDYFTVRNKQILSETEDISVSFLFLKLFIELLIIHVEKI